MLHVRKMSRIICKSKNLFRESTCAFFVMPTLETKYRHQVSRHYTLPADVTMNVFDRKAKRLQKDRSAMMDDWKIYDYIKDEIGWRVADRIHDIKRKFDLAVELGCGRGYIGRHVTQESVGMFLQCDMSEKLLHQCYPSEDNVMTCPAVVDEEFLPFRENSIDLFVSSLSLHWANDLPGCFRQIFSSLKNDGAFIAAVFGGETLYELRCSLQQAEMERDGGLSTHISPFTEASDLGMLLNRAGYKLLTLDVDELTVNYPSMFELMQDLKGMGENNASWRRPLRLKRDTMFAAGAIYQELYGNKDGSVPATFQILHLIGWKPDKSQPQPVARGSQNVSLKDLDQLDKLRPHDLKNDDKPS